MQEWIAYNRKASCKIANVLWKKTKLAYCVHAFILTYFSVLQNEGARVERHSQLTQLYVVCSL
jgi:hypothetical protein